MSLCEQDHTCTVHSSRSGLRTTHWTDESGTGGVTIREELDRLMPERQNPNELSESARRPWKLQIKAPCHRAAGLNEIACLKGQARRLAQSRCSLSPGASQIGLSQQCRPFKPVPKPTRSYHFCVCAKTWPVLSRPYVKQNSPFTKMLTFYLSHIS